MDQKPGFDQKLSASIWGVLLIFWGICIFFDRISFGVGVAGTGLILLGLNLVRTFKGIPTRGTTTVVGILSLIWGALELLRPIAGPLLHLPFQLNDWAIFSILLVALGVILLGAVLLRNPQATPPNSHSHS
jgi:hypothetical protein